MADLAIYVVVMIFDHQIAPIGKVYYNLNEAREQRDKHEPFHMATIIKLTAGNPPMVEI